MNYPIYMIIFFLILFTIIFMTIPFRCAEGTKSDETFSASNAASKNVL